MWLAWMPGIGPPRGREMSFIYSVGSPAACAARASSSSAAMVAGWPQNAAPARADRLVTRPLRRQLDGAGDAARAGAADDARRFLRLGQRRSKTEY